MQVMIILTERCMGSQVVGFVDALMMVNYCHHKAGGEAPLFEWSLVSSDGQPVLPFNGLPVAADQSLAQALADRRYPIGQQLWLVPSIIEAVSRPERIRAALDRMQPVIAAVQQHYQRGGRVASACTGAFALAEAGLLGPYPALMHWRSEASFQRLFPGIRTDTHTALADYGRILCTSGGMQSAAHLVLHLVARLHSEALALEVAKMMQIDRQSTAPVAYAATRADAPHNDDKVRMAQARMRERLHLSVSIEQLAAELAISDRQLKRRFAQATGLSPLKYLQKERLKRACQLLENSRLPSARIAGEVGYQDESNFRRLFKRELGMTMEHYRRQFSAQNAIEQ
ncbi:GlxA family transcriptional regulator [Saccharospirillum mangrovi]|uniref:GlxA family transcriptional regulator n=1 Tax=Saccharospirillum mangrovi TaxID=2161747 RepID=UPI000D384F71|nr:helix-turn-helix domain-containing protein [Saccharospirillum mangrovi]